MTSEANKKRPMILGIGGSGAAMIEQLALLPGINEYILALIDTDRDTTLRSAAELRISAAVDWGISNSGGGCGGDIIRGERAMARERQAISEMLEKASFLTVCGGLGGGTATGGARTIASVARNLKLPAVFLLTTPFSFESYSRRHNAQDCVRELLPMTDILLTLPNDLLFAQLPPDLPAEQAFERSSIEMAYTVFGMSELMRCRNLLGADYAAFMAPVRGQLCDCSIGIGAADGNDGLDRSAIALDRLLQSPFLGGMERIRKADAAFVILSGGTDLQLAEMKRSIEMASDVFPQKIELLSGAAVAPSMNGRIQLTAIVIRYVNPPPQKKQRPVIPATQVPTQELPLSEPHRELIQEEFTLTSFSRGIFENTPPSKYMDEDLDIPTFQRQKVSIDRGKTGV